MGIVISYRQMSTVLKFQVRVWKVWQGVFLSRDFRVYGGIVV